MEKRICWKKGMRLTDQIMRASDVATADRIGDALALASAGRFGLLPGPRRFQISLNLNANYVEVQALDCLAVTRGGLLIDAQFDTKYTNHLERRVAIPDGTGETELLLTIGVDPNQWEETVNGYEEPVYVFSLVGVNSLLSDNVLPIAHLVYSEQIRGWQIDMEDYLPPCLFVSSHRNYVELLNQFVQKLQEVESKVLQRLGSGNHEAFRILWPHVQQILIETDKNRDLMTPMALLGNVQKFVAVFTAACHLDQYLNLSDADMFRNYALAPCDYANTYSMIKVGIRYCFLISEKVDKIEVKQPEMPKAKSKIEAPSIADDQLYLNCRTSVVSVPIINKVKGATVYYSTDGSMPSKEVTNGKVRIKNTFNSNKEDEDDQEYVVKLKAVLDDSESDVSSFTIVLHKDCRHWIQI